MSSGMNWTNRPRKLQLQASQQDVMDAVQKGRCKKAHDYGLSTESNSRVVVGGGSLTSPSRTVNPGFIVVPYYDPGVVFFAPRPGFVVGGAIRFGFGVTIGGFFRPWGWGYGRFDWGGHAVFINNAPWRRTWVNRGSYVHPYAGVRRYAPAEHAAEHHELERRSEAERSAELHGRRPVEEHHPAHEEHHDHGHDHHGQ